MRSADASPLLPPVPVAVLLGVLLLLPASATAQDWSRNGAYLGVGVLGGAYTRLDDETEDALGVDVDTEVAAGFELTGGYRLHPNLALEGEFELLSDADIDVGALGDVAEIDTWTLTANAKAFALTGRVQPYALLGLGLQHAELEDSVGLGVSEDESDFAARFGAGIDGYLTRNIVLYGGVDYVLPTDDLEDLDTVSFGGGLRFRF